MKDPVSVDLFLRLGNAYIQVERKEIEGVIKDLRWFQNKSTWEIGLIHCKTKQQPVLADEIQERGKINKRYWHRIETKWRDIKVWLGRCIEHSVEDYHKGPKREVDITTNCQPGDRMVHWCIYLINDRIWANRLSLTTREIVALKLTMPIIIIRWDMFHSSVIMEKPPSDLSQRISDSDSDWWMFC